MRTALFRLEFGGGHGWGHLVRSGALAAELRRRGWRCVLWTESRVNEVPPEMCAHFDEVVTGLAGAIPGERNPGWLVVDHYGITDEQLQDWRVGFSGRMLVIDDEAKRTLGAADLAVNTRLGLRDSPYATGVRALLGEEFALLRAGLEQPVGVDTRALKDRVPVLVMMGGTDPAGVTDLVLRTMQEVDPVRLMAVVIRPQTKAAGKQCDAPSVGPEHVVFLDTVNERQLAGWCRACRFAISAAGGTLYELAACRLPFVAVVVAENQRALAAEASRLWGMPVAEAGPSLRRGLAEALRDMLSRVDCNAEAMRAAFSSVDFRGPARVADAMIG